MRYLNLKEVSITTIVSFVAVALVIFVVAMWSMQSGMIQDKDHMVSSGIDNMMMDAVVPPAEQPMDEA